MQIVHVRIRGPSTPKLVAHFVVGCGAVEFRCNRRYTAYPFLDMVSMLPLRLQLLDCCCIADKLAATRCAICCNGGAGAGVMFQCAWEG